MNTITNNTHSRQLAGSSALLALFIAVLATFVMGFAAPAAHAQYDSGFDLSGCSGCGGSTYTAPGYDYNTYTAPSYSSNTYTAPAYDYNSYSTPGYNYSNTTSSGYDSGYTVNGCSACGGSTYTAPGYDYNTYTAPSYSSNTYTAPAYDYNTYTSPYDTGTYANNAPYYAEASYGNYAPTTSTYVSPYDTTYYAYNYPTYTGVSYAYVPPASTYVYQSGYQGSYQGYYQGSYTPPTPPPTYSQPNCTLNASATSMDEGQNATLTWTTNNATSASLSNFGSVNTGSGSRSLGSLNAGTYNYVLNVSGQGGSNSCQVTIHVNQVQQNVSCNISADNTSISDGDTTRLYWNTNNASNAYINQGIGNVSNNSSRTISPSVTTTYTLTAQNSNGTTQSCDVTVHVSNTVYNNLSCNLAADDTSIVSGNSTILRWNNNNATNAYLNQGIGSVNSNSGSTRVYPAVTTTYQLTVNNNGNSRTCQTTVYVGDTGLSNPPNVPLVYLSQLPYTGSDMDAGALMTYWLLIISAAGIAGYFIFFRVLPFAFAKVNPVHSVSHDGDSDAVAVIPENVTRQDVRAFVSALAENDTDSVCEFAKTNSSALFAETAVVLDDVLRFRREGSVADSTIAAMTASWSDQKVQSLVDTFAEATNADETVAKVLTA